MTDYPLYKVLGENNEQRWEHYRSLFERALNPDEVQKIRKAAVFSTPHGNERFREQIEAALNRSVGNTTRGRPVRKERKWLKERVRKNIVCDSLLFDPFTQL